MATSNQFLDYVTEQLQGLERLISRRMFGGAGLYKDEIFFGLIYKDRLYFRTDDTTRAEYEARGGEAFRPRPQFASLKAAAYYTVPADVLEDSEELTLWARRSVAAALASQAEKAKRKRPAGKTDKAVPAGKRRKAKRGATRST